MKKIKDVEFYHLFEEVRNMESSISDKSDKRQYVGETGKTLEERVKGHLKLNSVR